MTHEHTINAAGKKLGRISSEAAKVLLGKTSADFENHKVADVKVTISNASKMDISDKKKQQEVRKRYSGYPGGQKVESLGEHIARVGIAQAVQNTVKKMLPKNRLRDLRLKNLTILEGEAQK